MTRLLRSKWLVCTCVILCIFSFISLFTDVFADHEQIQFVLGLVLVFMVVQFLITHVWPMPVRTVSPPPLRFRPEYWLFVVFLVLWALFVVTMCGVVGRLSTFL